MKFVGKVVLVTGSSRGIGASIARAFAQEGATVVINFLQNKQAAEEVVASCIRLGGEAWSIQADVIRETDVQRMVEEIEAETGRLDIVVNNAFKSYQFNSEQRKMAWDLTWEDYHSQLEGTLHSTHNVCQAVLPVMKKQSRGSIINIVSDLVARPIVPYHDYTTAKAALVGYSRNLAADLGMVGIRVNCVAPGLVYPTAASEQTSEAVKELIVSQTPLRRIASPEDITGPVLFLASEWSRFMTGQTLYVDGGLVM